MFANFITKLPSSFVRSGKLPLFLMIVSLATLPYAFYIFRDKPAAAPTEHLVAFDDISDLMQLEFRFQKLFDSVNEYRLSPSDGIRKDIEFHREILKIHVNDEATQRVTSDAFAGSNSLTVINSTPQMLDLISSEIDLFLISNDPNVGRRLAEKIQSFLFEFHSELMYLSDLTNQMARQQEMAVAANVQRDFGVLFVINLLMVIVLSIFSYALSSKERKLTERTDEVAASERKSEAKTRYLASMSHEIRTPMQGIIGLTQILSQTELDENQRRNLGLIATSATTLLGILNDILDIAKIEAEKMELSPAAIDFRKTVEEVVQLSSSIAKEKDVDLQFSFSPSLPDRILADGTRMKQVLLNLSSNAIKFSAGQADGKRGQVKISFEAREEGRVYFTIADNGIGMSPEVLGRLFTPYTQASRDTSSRFGGTGLGLTITKQIVDLMVGTIHVDSQVGVGSTFCVDIPIKEIAAQADKVDLQNRPVISLLEDEISDIDVAGHVTASGGHFREAHNFSQVLDQLFDSEIAPVVLIGVDRLLANFDQVDRVYETFPRAHFLAFSDRVVPAARLPRNASTVDTCPLLPSVLLGEILAGSRPRAAKATVSKLPAPKSPSASLAPPQPNSDSPSKGRILVAEDNQINQMVLQTQLRKMGYHVDIVGDGEQALAKWKADNRYDVILSDCNMPVMDGLQFARTLRCEEGTDKRIPLIALTADAFEEQRLECLDAGMDDFLVKPTSVEELGEKLEFWLRKSPPQGRIANLN